MYFISRDYGNDVYEITDSTDNIAEKYTITEIESIVSRGFSIKGYSTKKCRVFPTLDDYIEFELTKDRLNGGYKYRNFVFDSTYTTLHSIVDRTGTVVVPEFIKYLRNCCFSTSPLVERVVITGDIIIIPFHCFEGCHNLKEVQLPNSLERINSCVFKDCSSLQTIQIPTNVDFIGKHGFENCISLKHVSLPDEIVYIGNSCFRGCEALENITLGSQLACIPCNCFENCTSLKQIIIPDSVKELHSFCFYNCSALEYVQLPMNLTYFDKDWFVKCKSLKTISIPKELERYRDEITSINSNDIEIIIRK